MITEALTTTCAITLALFIWLETDAFVEYIKLLRLNKYPLFEFLRVNEYEEYVSKNLEEDITYPDFLSYECGNFLTTLRRHAGNVFSSLRAAIRTHGALLFFQMPTPS